MPTEDTLIHLIVSGKHQRKISNTLEEWDMIDPKALGEMVIEMMKKAAQEK